MAVVLFRADGSNHLGMGHIMRCLAFARGLNKIGLKSVFVVRNYAKSIVELIKHYEFEVEIIPPDASLVEDATMTSEFVCRYYSRLIVFDIYNSDNKAQIEEYNRYFPLIKTASRFMIAIDDPIRDDSLFDMQIIPYYGEEGTCKKYKGETKVLLGPDYFVFQEEFTRAAKVPREIKSSVQNVMVTMGGSDPHNLTPKVVKALNNSDCFIPNLKVVIGPGYTPTVRLEIETILKEHQGNHTFVLNCDNMADLMLWSDLGITSGGLTKYEMAITGTPSITISSFEEEAERTRLFAGAGSTLYLGNNNVVTEREIAKAVRKLLNDYTLRMEMNKAGRKLVDGQGIDRIISEIPARIIS